MAKDKELYDNKMAFFSSIVSEIKTPIGLIKAPLELALGSDGIKGKDRENLQIVEKNADKLSRMISQLVDFRKIGENSFEFHFVHRDIRETVREHGRSIAGDCEKGAISLNVSLPEEQVVMKYDPESLGKLLDCLLGNAVKFTKDRIDLNLRAGGGNVIIEVSNNGNPIEERYRSKLFTPFFQIRGNDSDSQSGTGLGLALAKYIAERHNGRIGEGYDSVSGMTRFTVTLPYEASSETVADSPLQQTDTESGIFSLRTMLFVDDNPEIRDFVCSNFGSDFNILTAENGMGALEVLKTEMADIVVSDVKMDPVDGFELCRILRQTPQTCQMPIILLSSQGDEAYKDKALKCGCDVFMEKPFSVKSLRLHISNLIKNRDTIKELYSKSPLLPAYSIAHTNRDAAFIDKVNILISKHLSKSDNILDEIAEGMAMSKGNLRKKLVAISGMPPVRYVQLVKLKRAAELLKTTDMKVNEVASAVGFVTPSYFAKCFFAQFGVLPKDYR